jgi:acyl carrier protein
MIKKETITQVIFKAIDEINETLPKEQWVQKSIDTLLFGTSSKLDSLGLITLIVAIEQKIEEETKTAITLTDEETISYKNNPFQSVKTLTDHISFLLEGKPNESTEV